MAAGALDEAIAAALADLDAHHRRRVPRTVASAQGTDIVLDGAEVVSFSANDYLGLAADPRLVAAATEAAQRYGVGAGASRLVVGNHTLHEQLQDALAAWLRLPAVTLFSSGWAANTGIIPALVGPDDAVFSDRLNHASIIDGCRASRAKVQIYDHGDLDQLGKLLDRSNAERDLVVSESLFSMDGDVVDVVGLAEVCRAHGAALMIDEAHALGVLGPRGRGVCAERGVVPDLLIGTLGKAFGAAGAFAATSRDLAAWLWNRARSLVFSTAPPPMIAAAALAALAIIDSEDGDVRRGKLEDNARRIAAAAGGAWMRWSPIIPFIVGDDEGVMALTGRLLAEGLYVQGIRPPTVPEGTARLRITASSQHTTAEVDRLCAALGREPRPAPPQPGDGA